MDLTPELVEQVTRRVLGILSDEAAPKLPQALVAGSLDAAGERLCRKFALMPVAECGESLELSSYAFLLITRMTNAQLADLALGRDESPIPSAAVRAVLMGKDVYLLPEALFHRGFQQTANPRFYQMMEDYVKRIEAFGIRMMPLEEVEAAVLKQPKSGEENSKDKRQKQNTADGKGKLLSAIEAKALAYTCGASLTLEKGTIITPLARDVLREANIRICYRQEESTC